MSDSSEGMGGGGKTILIAAVLVLLIPVVIVMALMGSQPDCDTGANTGGGQQSGTSGDTLPPGSKSMPLKRGTFTETSGWRSAGRGDHRGVDLGANMGTPMYAAYDGTVNKSGYAGGFGDWIVLDHNIDGKVVSTVYGHMYEKDLMVKVGDKVRAGQQISRVGSNGQSSGPHLHFEVWPGGRFGGGNEADPMAWLRGAAEPGSARPAPTSGERAGGPAPGGGQSPPGTVTKADWEKIAQHESGGNWKINTGNTYYGGLQFSSQSWQGAGGTKFAARADQATPEQQMEAANTLLRMQGWNAWPQTSYKAGVREKKPAPEGTFVGAGREGGGADSARAPPENAGAAQQLAALPASKGSEEGMQVDAVRVARWVAARFPQVARFETGRPGADDNHGQGRAVDIMVPDYQSGAGKALGDNIVQQLLAKANDLGVEALIWRQTYIPVGGERRPMADRGSDNENHYNHVHVDTKGGGPAAGKTITGPGDAADSSTSDQGPNPSATPMPKECEPGNKGGGGGTLKKGSVPPAFEPWLLKAGAMCAQIKPALLAAQLGQENGFQYGEGAPVSPKGALGPAQFMPGTWPSYGRDDDGNGRNSPLDIGDAVMAQGRFMCEIADTIDKAIASGKVNDQVPGGRLALYLAGYNAGPGAVLQSGGMPTGDIDYVVETAPYAKKILAAMPKYEGIGSTDGAGGALSGSSFGEKAVSAARSQMGVTYAWGGGNADGPTKGISDGGGPADAQGDFNKVGFDCAGLMVYAWAQATGKKIVLPAGTYAQVGAPGTHKISRAELRPGDLIFPNPGHVQIYAGNGKVIHSPQSGEVVKESPIGNGGVFVRVDTERIEKG